MDQTGRTAGTGPADQADGGPPQAEALEALRRGLAYPLGARLFFWADIVLNAVIIRIALMGDIRRNDPEALLLVLPVLVTVLCLTRAIPYTEYLAYLRIPYVLIMTAVLTWAGLRQLHPLALVLAGFVGLWHVPYALAVRSYQKSKARLRAARELLKALQAGGEDAGPEAKT